MNQRRGTIIGIIGLVLYIPVIVAASLNDPPDGLTAFAMGTLLIGMIMVMIAIFNQVRR
jgi:hypothetical protein